MSSYYGDVQGVEENGGCEAMKVVFVYPKEPHMSFGQIGLETIAGVLVRAGHSVYGLVDSTYDPSSRLTSDEQHNLSKIGKIEPYLVGISVLSHRYQWCLKFARLVKRDYPNIKIIFGGPHPTAVPEIVIQENCVDMVCVGEGEGAMLELANSPERIDIKNIWFKTGGEIIKNGLRPLVQDLDSVNPPMRSIWIESVGKKEFNRYLVMVGRGCPRSCTYCSNSFLHELNRGLGKYVRLRSVNNVIDELKTAKKEFEASWFLFMDDNFTLNKDWLKDFASQYKKYIGDPYACNTHPLDIDDEVAQWLKDSGCRFVMVGIQSGSEEVRRRVVHRYETNDDVRRMASSCHRAGLSFSLDHIFGLDDRLEYMRESAYLYNEVRPFQVNIFFLYMFPKTPIIEIKGLSKEDRRGVQQGTYQPPTIRSSRDPKYITYRNLFICLPILPKRVVNWVLDNNREGTFDKIPEFVLWIMKVITNIRGGNTPSIIAHLKFLPHKLKERLRGYRGKFD